MEPTTPTAPRQAPDARPPIEVGWVLVGRFDPPDREATRAARERLRSTLSRLFPDFDWRMPVVEREGLTAAQREQPVELLEHGLAERQARRWDFTLVVTGGDLRSFYKPFAFGAPSRALAVAVMSTSRIDPRAGDRGAVEEERAEVMAGRLHALAVHLFGHLNGLDHAPEPEDYMFDVETVDDLDRMERLSSGCHEQLRRELASVADTRLEEESEEGGSLAFYLRAMWRARGEIAGAVRHARPWQLPFRLSRLTTAAFSALLVLLITAEAWDLGMSQQPWFVVVLSVVVLTVTSIYLLLRQRLLMHREGTRLSELTVVTNVSMVLAVTLGMLTAYAVLFVATLLIAGTLFSAPLVAQWVASLGGEVTGGHYLVLAAFVSSLGLLIGALGASFEEQRYFHHVAYVDEET